MSFTDLGFPIFLGVVLILFRIFPMKRRSALLLASSIFFYAAHDPLLLPLVFSVIWAAWMAGLRRTRRAVGLCVCWCLLMLLIFKYLQPLLNRNARLGIPLPMGISFYTFQALSYVLDARRGEIQPEKRFDRVALYVLFFPQLVAGPIEQAGDLLPQLASPTGPHADDLWQGLLLILRGYMRKVLIADVLSGTVDRVFAAIGQASGTELLLGVIFFSIQIYGDFAGYSDIAQGTALLMGIRLSENFRKPYEAQSVTEFWRRWHITLSRWFRNYVYIPLGGRRHGRVRWFLSIMAVFLLSGIWHGAGWTFVIWGGLQGALVVAERGLRRERWRLPHFTGVLLTWISVCIGWVFFRAASVNEALSILSAILREPFSGLGGLIGTRSAILSVTLCLLTPLVDHLPRINKDDPRPALLCWFFAVLAIVTARCMVLSAGGNPAFIYFQF